MNVEKFNSMTVIFLCHLGADEHNIYNIYNVYVLYIYLFMNDSCSNLLKAFTMYIWGTFFFFFFVFFFCFLKEI